MTKRTSHAALAGAILLAAAAVPPTAGFAQSTQTAIFAGGCFWCVESDFDLVDGVLETTSGYIGGALENPTYEQVSGTETGHYEAVRITFDPSVVTYDELLNVFWHSVDPTDAGGQFCDRGSSYRTAIFATNEAQMEAAQVTKAEAAADLGEEIATVIETAPTFYPAEDYHQDYYEKNALKYKYYRYACGRNETVEGVWGDQAFAGIKDAMS